MNKLLNSNPGINRTSFSTLGSLNDIAQMLEIKSTELKYVLYRIKKENKYYSFSVVKRRGGARTISAPCRQLKFIQQRLCEVLSDVYIPKPYVHGFAINRSILSNAKIHTAQKYVLNIDLMDFFPSINFGRVRGMFIAKPYNLSPAAATILAQICCIDSLPQGAPTSPIVANMICGRFDSEVARLAWAHKCHYTRYADDLTFSTARSKFPERLAICDDADKSNVKIAPELMEIIERNGFSVNISKTTFRTRSRRQEVTGLVINRTQNVKKEFVKQIRAMLHAWKKYGEECAERAHFLNYNCKHRNPARALPRFRKILAGKIQFVGMIRGKNHPLYIRFCREFNELAPNYLSFIDTNKQLLDALWIIESEQHNIQGTGVMIRGIGLVTCDHVLRADSKAFKALDHNNKYELIIVSRSESIDLAVLQIQNGQSQNDELLVASSEWQRNDQVVLAGFPNYRYGDTGIIKTGHIIGFRTVSAIQRALIDASIIAGNSGGPVVNTKNEVIGIAVTGADRMEESEATEHHSVIPVSALSNLAC